MSSVFITGIFIFNFFNYLFQLVSARFLGPAFYGEVGAILSIMYLFTIPSEIIGTSIITFGSKLKVKKQFGKLKSFFKFSIKTTAIFFSVSTLILLLLTPLISNFLKLSSTIPLIIFFIFILTMIPTLTNRAFMQTSLKFTSLSVNIVAESLLKFSLALLFLFLGFKITGIFVAVLMAGLITAILSFIPIRKIFSYKAKKINTKKILTSSKSISLILIGITAMYSVDILLAKHFLLPEQAGFYAALSLFGKTIFFGSFAVIKVMFAQLFEKSKLEKRKLVLKALSLLILGSAIALFVFLIFPAQLVTLLLGKEYLPMAKYLFKFGLAMTLFSISYLIAHYNISKQSKKGTIIFPVFALIEIILIILMSQSLASITNAILITMSLLFVVTIVLPGIKKIGEILKNEIS